MLIKVIDVGDGACTAAFCCWDCEELTLVDCGTHQSHPVPGGPGVAAAAQLGGCLANLTTIVVTHFDSDHWGGLVDLAPLYAKKQPNPQRQIRLYYPGMPVEWATPPNPANTPHVNGDKLLMGMIAVSQLVSPKNADPVSAIKLRKAWLGSAVIKHSPLYRGDEFIANGRTWTVHWPPRRAGVAKGKEFESWLQRVYDLGKEMATDYDNPDTRLRDQLDEAYKVVRNLHDNEDARIKNDSDEPFLTQLQEGKRSAADEESIDENRGDDYDLTVREGTQATSLDLDHISESYRVKVKEIADGLSGIDNYFSLVVSVSDEFLCLGDIEKTALGELLRISKVHKPMFADRYALMLAPHHGTHERWAGKLPIAVFCISQNGRWLKQFNFKHKNRHKCNSLSTRDCGSMTFESYGPHIHRRQRFTPLWW